MIGDHRSLTSQKSKLKNIEPAANNTWHSPKFPHYGAEAMVTLDLAGLVGKKVYVRVYSLTESVGVQERTLDPVMLVDLEDLKTDFLDIPCNRINAEHNSYVVEITAAVDGETLTGQPAYGIVDLYVGSNFGNPNYIRPKG